MYNIKAQNPGKLGKLIFLRFYSRNNVADRCWLNNMLYRVAQLLLFCFVFYILTQVTVCEEESL